jgi:putative ABC transport system permease protein
MRSHLELMIDGNILQDLRTGFRNIRILPCFSLVLILTLGLGIGTNTAIFSVIYAALLAPPPYPGGERLVEIWEATAEQKIPVTWINFQHWRDQNHSFEEMAGFETTNLTLTGHGDAKLTRAAAVSASFFRLTGWRPLHGRLLMVSDDRPNAAPVVLVTAEFWARVLGGNPQVVGNMLTLDGKAYQIIGILSPGLKFFTQPIDVYVPVGLTEGNAVSRGDHGSMAVLGLLKPHVEPTVARRDLDAIMSRLALTDPGSESDHHSSIAWLGDSGAASIRPSLLILMGAVGLLLVIACVNVASLLLVRSTARSREIAIRSALGAGRIRLARQLLTESTVIFALGGGVGLLLAGACLRAVVLTGPRDIPRLGEAGLNLPVLSFTAVVTLIACLLVGLAPLLSIRSVDLTAALKEGSPAAGTGRRKYSLQSGLVIAEIAITLVLSFGCGLLLRSLIVAQTAFPGFEAAGVLALEVQLPPSRYKVAHAKRRFYDQLMQNLRREHGVSSVGIVDCPPSTGGCAKGWYSIADMPAPLQGDVPLTILTKVDPAYLHTMGIRLLAGRGLAATDREGGLLINEELARRWWPNAPQLAVGHRLKLGGPDLEGPTSEILGVVANVTQVGLDAKPFAEVYIPFSQNPSAAMVLMIRATGDPARLAPMVRRELASLDSNVPVQSLRPFEDWMKATLERRRFSTLLLGTFAALAMVLSLVGIYGILNYWVGVRQKEIAIRLALGAQRPDILRWMAGNVMRLMALGVGLGVIGGWVAARGLNSMLFGVSAQNPGIMFAAVVSVFATAMFAAISPMWRAMRVDATRNLRET